MVYLEQLNELNVAFVYTDCDDSSQHYRSLSPISLVQFG